MFHREKYETRRLAGGGTETFDETSKFSILRELCDSTSSEIAAARMACGDFVS